MRANPRLASRFFDNLLPKLAQHGAMLGAAFIVFSIVPLRASFDLHEDVGSGRVSVDFNQERLVDEFLEGEGDSAPRQMPDQRFEQVRGDLRAPFGDADSSIQFSEYFFHDRPFLHPFDGCSRRQSAGAWKGRPVRAVSA